MPATPAEVQSQLERILASQTLAGSDQLKRLLRTVVERTLTGHADLLKEYNLGLEVFHRPPDYDPKADPIVRVQARRLRSKLEEYYARDGAGDPLLIHIPKGGYVPVFQPHSPPAHASAVARFSRTRAAFVLVSAVLLVTAFVLAWRGRPGFAAPVDIDRSVAVLPLQNYAGNGGRAHVAEQFTEVLTTSLARDERLRVLSHTTAMKYRDRRLSLPEIARELHVRWVVEGGVGTEGQRAYIKLRAVDAQTDRKVWADMVDCGVGELFSAGAKAAKSLADAIDKHRQAHGG